eukprot:TRINITY_DN3319_c0_g2_i1.p1 TRINITY_DN3319_c0_g2~~TRINITY_DN3319_c0_g2_i1.p1  ORF type:complete len:436 (+),score=76.51 TRINITY_DN3319_c0_g2_i1:45-1310(+)
MSSLMLAMVAGAAAVIYPPAPRGTIYIDFSGTTCANERQKTLEVSLGYGGPVECDLKVVDPANPIDLTVAGTSCVKALHDRVVAKTNVIDQARCYINDCCYLPGTTDRYFKSTHNTVSCGTATPTPLTTTFYTDNTCTTVDVALNIAPGQGSCQGTNIKTTVPISVYHYAWDKTAAQICQLFSIATKLEIAGTTYTTNYYNGNSCTDGSNLVAAGNLYQTYSLNWNSVTSTSRNVQSGLVPIDSSACGANYVPCTGCCRLFDRYNCQYVSGLYERITKSCNSDTLLVVRRQVFLDEMCDQLHTAYPAYDEITTFDSKATCSSKQYLLQSPGPYTSTQHVVSTNGRWEATQVIVPGDTDFCVAARISKGYSDLLVDDAAAEAQAEAARNRVKPIPVKYYDDASASTVVSATVLVLTVLAVLL